MKYVLVGAIIILAVFLIVLSFIPLGIEPLTELYFENHTTLPKIIFLNKPYNFSFTVHNLEYQDMRYKYDIRAFDENNTLLFKMDSREILLVNNETKTIFESFNMKDHFGRMKININLKKDDMGIVPDFKKKLWWPDPNYPNEIDIHFWAEEIAGPTITIVPD